MKTAELAVKTADTLPKLFLACYREYGEAKVAMLEKERGIWQTFTWKEYYEKVKYFSLGLISMGLKRGDKVSILGENQPEWYWADLAVQSAGGVVVGIFTDCMAKEVQYYASHSDSKFLLAHDQEQVDKVLEIKEQLPLVEKVIYWDPKGLWFYDMPYLMSFEKVLELGKEYEKEYPNLFEENITASQGDDIALMLFTSGTTGLPKAALVEHRNVLTAAKLTADKDKWLATDYYVSAISPAWITEHGAMAQLLYVGGTTCFPESADTVQEDIRDIGPQTLFFAARQLENIARVIQAKIIDTAAIKRFLYKILLPVGYKKADTEIAGKELTPIWKCIYGIADFLIFRNIRDKFGILNATKIYSGGAAVSPDILRFYRGIGVNIKIGYGSSEGGGVTTPVNDNIKLETAGAPLLGVEIRLNNDDQLVIKGPGVFQGYYKNEEATRKAVVDGWYQTGDFCHIDEDGQLIVMGRMSDVRRLSTGKSFAPDYIEIRLRFSPFIKDALVFGRDNESYVTAIVNIDKETVGRWAEGKHIAYTTFTDLSQKDEVLQLISKELEKVNKALPEHARMRKFVSLNKEFDPDESELTRTRKLRRAFVEQRFKEIIDAMYSDKKQVQIQSEITYRDGRKGMIETSLKINSISRG